MFDPDFLLSMPPLHVRHAVTPRDIILYALGVGVGVEAPTDPGELQYLLEDRLKVLPSFASVLAYPGFWAREPKYGIAWKKVLAGDQSIQLHRPLPPGGEFTGATKVDAIYDKGAGKGALIYSSRTIRDAHSGEAFATVRQSMFARDDGGFGGSSEGAPKPAPTPERAPDQMLPARTYANQALIYRLSGDYNALHSDPDIAREAGFPRPILHGLGTVGVVVRALVKSVCDDQPERVRRIDVRYSSPVLPGDELVVDIWRFGSEGRTAFQVRVPARDVTVLRNGVLEFDR